MRNLWRALRPYLILALLGGALIWPLLGPDVPCTDDGQLYYYQTAALEYSVRHGLLYSRWMPDAALGYGLPFFNYREPLPRYLVLGLALAGFSVPRALNLTAALAILATGWGTYRLARDVLDDEVAGLVAGAAAMAAPYVLLNVFRRGALPESVALALTPWVFRAFWRAGRSRRGLGAAAGAALGWAALILSHNISALLMAPALAGYALLIGWLERPRNRDVPRWVGGLRSLLRMGVAYAGGLVLAAFYWVPAFFEKNLIRIGAATATRNNSYIYNFVAPAEVFAPPAPVNPAWLNPPMVIRLGLVMAIMALIGGVGGWLAYRDRERRAQIAAFAVMGIGYLLMVFPLSRPVWDAIPVLAFVQFPWRLVGRAALAVAVLAGAAAGAIRCWLPAQHRRRAVPALTGGLAILLLVTALPESYPLQWCPLPPRPTIVDVNRFERDVLPGLDNEGSYFPAGVTLPHDSPLLADYEAGRTPQRLDVSAAPPGAEVAVRYRPPGATATISTPEAFTARYLSYAFPGWVVRIDGERTAIAPEPESGLITFTVPAGEHEVVIRFGTTPLRAVSSAISLIGGLGLAALVGLSLRRGGADDSRAGAPERSADARDRRAMWLALAAVGVALSLARAAWPDDVPAPWRVTRPPAPQHPADVLFEGQVRLLGYDLPDGPRPADEEIRVDTYWARAAETTHNTQVALSVLDEEGLIWSEKEGARPRGYEEPPLPTFLWPPETFVTDSQLIRLLPGTPPGTYTLAVTLFDRDTGQPLTAPRPAGGVITQLPVGTLEVAWPRRAWGGGEPGIQRPIGADVGGLTLLGANLDRQAAWPGETVLVTLFWANEGGGSTGVPALTLTFDGEPLAVAAFTRPAGSVPSGAVWREQALLRVPAGAEPGEHAIGLTGAGAEPLLLGGLTVREVARTFEPPPVDVPVGATFGGQITLLGLTAEADETTLAVTLVWQAGADVPISYTVFVHALDGEGNLIAQSDRLPAEGTRPTTGWLPGEVVTDVHRLAVEPGQVAALRVGLYDGGTGLRLRLEDGTDSVSVPLTP